MPEDPQILATEEWLMGLGYYWDVDTDGLERDTFAAERNKLLAVIAVELIDLNRTMKDICQALRR